MKCASLVIAAMLIAGAAQAQGLNMGNAEKGKEQASSCASCHGADGNSKSAQFPKLAGQNAVYIYRELKAFKNGERENAIMKSMAAGLSDEQMKNVAAYYASQKMTYGAADPDSVEAGQQLFRGGDIENGVPACMACHSPDGAGNPAAGYPRIAGQHAQYIVSQLEAYRSGKRSGTDQAKIMTGVAEHLTGQQIKAVSSYVQGLH